MKNHTVSRTTGTSFDRNSMNKDINFIFLLQISMVIPILAPQIKNYNISTNQQIILI